jgi:hypothetical protein
MPIVIAKAINSGHGEKLPAKKTTYQFSIYHSQYFLHLISGKHTKDILSHTAAVFFDEQ